MQPFAKAAAALLLLGTVTACGEDPVSRVSPKDQSTEERLAALEEDTGGVEQAIAAFNTAFDAKDVEGLRALFTNTAEIYLFDGRALKVEEFLTEMPGTWASWSNLHTEYRLHGVKLARPYGWAKYSEIFTYETDGQPRRMENLVTMALERRNGTWFINHLHLSSSTPPPPTS